MNLPIRLPSLACALMLVLLATGCAPVPTRNEPLASVQSPDGIGVALQEVIVPNAPGSFMKNARWDEYVVTLRNVGSQPIKVSAIELESALVPKGVHARGRKLLEDTTNENIRILTTADSALRTDLGDPQVCTSPPPAVVAAAFVGMVVLHLVTRVPVPMGHIDECKNDSGLRSRGFDLPLSLKAGSSATRSLFFPITPAPASLRVRYESRGVQGEVSLRLEPLKGLHLAPQLPPL